MDTQGGGDALRFRAALPSDIPRLVALEQRAFSVHQIGAEAFRRLICRESALVLVCEQGERFLGHAVVLFRVRATVARLYSIAIIPEARGCGAGRALLAELVRIVRDRGLLSVSLEVRKRDEAVRLFYERFGFLFKADLPGYYDDGAEAVRLVLEFAPARKRAARPGAR